VLRHVAREAPISGTVQPDKRQQRHRGTGDKRVETAITHRL
jgi:hypothetical protein